MGKSILIIEDDLDMVEAMKIVLDSVGHRVVVAYNPEDGFTKANEHVPDLIILDVMFGNHGHTKGFDYAVKFRQDKALAPVPIMMVTAINVEHPGFNFSTKTDGEFLPVDGFVNKPVEPDDLVKKVEELLNSGVSKWVNWPEKAR